MKLSRKAFIGAAAGTVIESYDFALFSLLLPIISPLFFPDPSPFKSLIKGYFLLSITMLARPLGGLLFGYLGDTIGRRKALLCSIYGIAFATLLSGLTPTFDTIGIWAVILLASAKGLQALCFGGEYNGAGIYVVEHAQSNKEAFAGSLLTATTLCGSLLASAVGVIITSASMPLWGWRVAFIFGGLVALVSTFYRKNLPESPEFLSANLKQHSMGNMIRLYPKKLLAGIFLGLFATAPFTTVFVFINPVLMTKSFFTSHQLMFIQTLLSFIAMLALALSGWFADKKSPLSIMKLGCLALIILPYFLLMGIDSGIFSLTLIAIIMLIIINEICLGPANAYLKNLFPAQYRYRASSLSFSIGMSLAGVTPLVESYLYQLTGQFSAISIWLIFIGAGTLVTLKIASSEQAIFAIAAS